MAAATANPANLARKVELSRIRTGIVMPYRDNPNPPMPYGMAALNASVSVERL